MRGVAIELVVEDGADRSVGERADLDGARGGRFQPRDAERPRQTQDAEAGSEPLFGMGPVLEDEIAQRCGCWPDESGVPADPADGPVGMAAMAGRHVVGKRRVLAVAASPHMHSDAFTLGEDLDRAGGETHFNLGAGEAMRHAVEVVLDIDVVVDADTTDSPLGEYVGLDLARA